MPIRHHEKTHKKNFFPLSFLYFAQEGPLQIRNRIEKIAAWEKPRPNALFFVPATDDFKIVTQLTQLDRLAPALVTIAYDTTNAFSSRNVA